MTIASFEKTDWNGYRNEHRDHRLALLHDTLYWIPEKTLCAIPEADTKIESIARAVREKTLDPSLSLDNQQILKNVTWLNGKIERHNANVLRNPLLFCLHWFFKFVYGEGLEVKPIPVPVGTSGPNWTQKLNGWEAEDLFQDRVETDAEDEVSDEEQEVSETPTAIQKRTEELAARDEQAILAYYANRSFFEDQNLKCFFTAWPMPTLTVPQLHILSTLVGRGSNPTIEALKENLPYLIHSHSTGAFFAQLTPNMSKMNALPSLIGLLECLSPQMRAAVLSRPDQTGLSFPYYNTHDIMEDLALDPQSPFSQSQGTLITALAKQNHPKILQILQNAPEFRT